MPKSRLARSKEKVASNTAAGGSSALCFNDVWELSVSVWLLVVVFVVSTLVCCVAGVLLWLELVDDGGMASHFGVHYHEDEHAEPPQQQSRLSAADLTRVLGFSRARLFAQLDRNWNGLLSLSEIEPLMQHARLDTQHPAFKYQKWLHSGAPCDNQCIELGYEFRVGPLNKCRFVLKDNYLVEFPLTNKQLVAMEDFSTATAANYSSESYRVVHVLTNGAPSVNMTANVTWRALEALLPRGRDVLVAGRVYDLLNDGNSFGDFFTQQHDRFMPGHLWEAHERALHLLLYRLHPRLFVHTRWGARLSSAVVRAMNEDLVDVFFRLHIEFQLNGLFNESVLMLTPSGLEGRLVASRAGGAPLFFEAGLAAEELPHGLNSLVDWPSETDGQGVGMCHLEQASVRLVKSNASALGRIQWKDAISPGEALYQLHRHMLPHRTVLWLPTLTDCIAASTLDPRKPLHLVVGFGNLFGQALPETLRLFREIVLNYPTIVVKLKYNFVNCWLNLADDPLPATTDATVRRLDGLVREKARLPFSVLIFVPRGFGDLGRFDSQDMVKYLDHVQSVRASSTHQSSHQQSSTAPDEEADKELERTFRNDIRRRYLRFLTTSTPV